MRPTHYIVIDSYEDFEQPLALRKGQGLPAKGVLDWGYPVCLFPSRSEAKEAITRTEHYRLAFNETGMRPEKKNCKVVPCVTQNTP